MRPRRHEASDVICLAVPDGVDPQDENFVKTLDALAWENVRKQFSQHARLTLTERHTEWLITNDPEKVEQFQPAHDCEECHAGNVKAKAFLIANPTATVAMGNVHYVEVWPEYDLPADLDDKERNWVTELLDADDRITVPQAIELINFAKQKGNELRRLNEEKAKAGWKQI